jgi:hypothetical protein
MKSYSTAPIDIKQPPLDVLNNVRAALDTVARINNLGLSFGLSSDPSNTSGLPADVDPPFYLVIYDERSNDLLGEPACDVGGPCESCQ